MAEINVDPKEIRDKFNDLFENSLDLILIFDLKGTIIDANDIALNSLGYTGSEIIGKSYEIFIGKKQGAEVKKAFQRFEENKKKMKFHEIELVTKDQNSIYIRFYVIPLKKNDIIYAILLIGNNITNSIKIEKNINESLEKYTLITENSNDLILILNQNSVIEYINDVAHKKTLGYTKDELLTMKIIGFIHPDDHEKIIKISKKDIDDDKNLPEIRFKSKNEGYKWFEFKSKKFKDSENQIKFLIFLKNIIKRKNLEEKIQDFELKFKNLTSSIPEIRFWNLFYPKKYEDALRTSYDILQDVIDNIPENIFWKDTNLVYLGCNKNHCRLIGLEKYESIIGKTDKDLPLKNLLSKEKVKELQSKEIQIIQSDKVEYHILETWILNNGKQIWLDVNRIPLHNSEEKVVGILVTYENVTEIKKSEIELKESEEKFRIIYNNANDAIGIINYEGRFIDVNNKFCEILGYTKEDLIGKSPIDISTNDATVINKRIQDTYEKGNNLFETNLIHKNHNIITLEISTKVIFFQNKPAIIIVGRDISERKKTELRLKASEEKYRSILESIKEGYFDVDLNGNFTFLNDTLCSILGYSKEEMMGNNFRKFVDEKDKKILLEVSRDILTSEKMMSDIQHEIFTKSGEKTFIELSAYIRHDANGNKVGFSGIVRDITKRKENENLEQKLKEQLENEVAIRTKDLKFALEQQKLYLDQIMRASQIKNEFLATFSHELRTPLNAMIGFTDILLEGNYGPLNAEQTGFLKDIKSSAEHQYEMIKQILDISKIEAGQTKLDLKFFSLNEMLNQIISSLKPLYSNKNINIKIKFPKMVKDIVADPVKIKEIIYNLLSNAFKFTIEGTITFTFKEDKKNWIISVKDTGIGIAEKHFNLIFQDFKRIDGPYVNGTPGVGLGLSLTKRLVNLHGGEIFFRSKLGKGSNFIFTIPKSLRSNVGLNVENFLNIVR